MSDHPKAALHDNLKNLEQALREADAKIADMQYWRRELALHVTALNGQLSNAQCNTHDLGPEQKVRRDLGPRGLGETITALYRECRHCRVLVPKG